MSSEPLDDGRKVSRLGRGLSALIGEVESMGGRQADPAPLPVPDLPIVDRPNEIALELIRRNPAQPRRSFDDGELGELAESLRTKGVLQAILVRPDPKEAGKFQIIAGERRWRAARMAGLTHIPAVVREVDDLALLEIGIIENVQRSDLNPIDEAEAYDALIKRFGRTQDSLATSVGKSRVHISNTLRLLQLSEGARVHVRAGRISAGHARAALGSANPEALIELAIERGFSVREVEAQARESREAGTGSKSSPPKVAPEKDVDTEALEADISRELGLVVDIRHGKDGGEIRIKYRDLEQLDEVCKRLTAKRKL